MYFVYLHLSFVAYYADEGTIDLVTVISRDGRMRGRGLARSLRTRVRILLGTWVVYPRLSWLAEERSLSSEFYQMSRDS